MHVLNWRIVSALTRGLFWCLFPELWSNKGNKHTKKNFLVWQHFVRTMSWHFSITDFVWGEWTGCCTNSGFANDMEWHDFNVTAMQSKQEQRKYIHAGYGCPFHKQHIGSLVKSWKVHCSDIIKKTVVRSDYSFACHDSSAVIKCTNLWPYSIITIKIRETYFLQDYNYELIKFCKMDPVTYN